MSIERINSYAQNQQKEREKDRKEKRDLGKSNDHKNPTDNCHDSAENLLVQVQDQ